MSASNLTVTLGDVAAAAGVSVSTASRALSGNAKACRISDATADRVRNHARRLGFRPNLLARSLQSRRSGLLGVVVPDVANPFFAAIAKEVTRGAEETGRSVLLADSGESSDREVKLVAELQARRVEGLVVCPVGVDSDHLEAANAAGTPVVVVDRGFRGGSLPTVTSDHRGGAERLVEHLVGLGHRAIGIVQGRPGTLPNDDRLRAARRTLAAAGVPADDVPVAGDGFTERSGYESAARLLADRPDVTALFAFSTPNAFGALRAAAEAGRSVPDDLAMVCFDEVPHVEFLRVSLTAAAQDVRRLGRTAAEVMAERLETGRPPRRRRYTVPVKFVARASSGGPLPGAGARRTRSRELVPAGAPR
ncbi:LacI family DNA-binding transcriptional regulator [Alienimonas californiensis]|uniref:HTH-type transcriptional regulator DegA n=1 Tax=Alienimonas californiensis TaxID=2527989 RepID=A0A517P8P5_9PLAN|nr:LacI family DNA-binding transcriptional regulator [Alienimonas californiensis]QDT15741.1 HTH-type transcriptional regulator DegA [Alienimonas californiensis]